MSKWKIAFLVSLAAFLATNGLWAYLFVDQSITLMYTDASSREQARAIQDLGALIVKGGESYTKEDVVFLLRQAKPDAFIVDNGEVVIFEGIAFRFSGDTLVEVGGRHS